MKRKSLFSLSLIVLAAAFFSLLTSCNPDEPAKEIDHKLHEDPVRAVFTLTEGRIKAGASFDGQPKMSDFIPDNSPAQVIEWATTSDQGWHVQSANKKFVVKNMVDNPEVVYSLTMDYYNSKGEKMNHQFFNEGQDKIHQHFFSMYKEVVFGGTKGMVRVKNKEELPYDYRYTDELNGSFIGDTNPMGFQGLLRFIKPGRDFELSVDLLHASGSKFDENNKPSPFFLPADVLLSTGQWDISVKLPVEIDGMPSGDDNKDYSKMIAPAKVVIEIYDGHLHGKYGFHQNPKPEVCKYMSNNYKLTYFLEDGKWVAHEDNPKRVSIIGSTQGGVSSFSIRYYSKEGDDITNELVINDEDKHYQHFFIARNIKPGYGGKAEASDKNGTDFFEYVYCDTDPWDKTNKFDRAKFIGEENPIGIKGYFTFKRSHKLFDIDIRLMRAENTKMRNGKLSPFYAPTDEQLKEELWLPTITVPMNVYIDADEKDMESIFVDDPSELSLDESDYSEDDLRVFKSIMEAFGLKTFQEALAELYWNINGDRKEDNTGFWF